MKKQNVKRTELVRWMVAWFLFSLSGFLMQIIAPEFPDSAVVLGILFFAMMVTSAAVIWIVGRRNRLERAAAAREAAGSGSVQ